MRLVMLLALTALGCNDCSSRSSSDERTEAELDRVLTQWPGSVDAGLAEQQRLETALGEALALTPASLTALLADPSASLETTSKIEGEGTATFTVESRERATRFVHEIAGRQGLVEAFELMPDGAAKVSVWYVDAEAHKAEVYPAWAPAPSDLWPCWGCSARAERITLKRDLANEFNAKLQRYRQLTRAQKSLKQLARYRASPKALAAFDAVVTAKPPDGTLIKLVSSNGSLSLCRTGWSVEQCTERLAGAGVCSLRPEFAEPTAQVDARRSEARGELCPLEVKP